MSQISKLSLIGLINIVVVVGGGFLLFTSFLNNVYESRDCEWANIDHVEMYIQMDIPNVGSSECDYNPETQTRLVKFQFDMHPKAVLNYPVKNKSSQLTTHDKPDFNQYIQPSDLLVEHQQQGLLFSKTGESEKAKWSTLYDKELGTLWVRIDYKQ